MKAVSFLLSGEPGQWVLISSVSLLLLSLYDALVRCDSSYSPKNTAVARQLGC